LQRAIGTDKVGVVQNVSEDFSDFDDTEAWPVLMDELV
jgi:hypothetical protein